MNYLNKYIKSASLSFVVAMLVFSCTNDDGYFKGEPKQSALAPEASFSASETSIIEHNSISFTDESTNNASLWTWLFPGGTPNSSNEKNPTVLYDVPGVYDVTLTVRNNEGASEIKKSEYIEVDGTPIPFLSYYEFSGNLSDIGDNSIAAVSNYGDPTYEDGPKGQSWVSPGVINQYLSIPNFKAIGGNGTRTVLAWFKTTNVGSRKTIVSWGRNSQGKMFNIMIQSGKIRIEAGACSLFTQREGLDDGNWHHLAVTYDPADGDMLADVKIYVDGVIAPNRPDGAGNSYRSEVVVIDTDIETNDVRIGDANYTPNYFWQGSIDDVRILDIVLIPAQIATIAAE